MEDFKTPTWLPPWSFRPSSGFYSEEKGGQMMVILIVYKQITTSSAMVQTTTPEVIPGATSILENGTVRGSPRESEFYNHSTSKISHICFITPQQTIYHPRTHTVCTRVLDTQMHNWLGSRWVRRRLGTARLVIVVRLSHSKRCTITRPPFLVKLRYIMWCALNQCKGRIFVRVL